jgi:hypothetical protein
MSDMTASTEETVTDNRDVSSCYLKLSATLGTRMVTLDDVRFDNDNVITGPTWAFRQDEHGELELIENAWVDIRAELARRVMGRLARAQSEEHKNFIRRRYGRLFDWNLFPRLRQCETCEQYFVGCMANTCTPRCYKHRLAILKERKKWRRRSLTVCQQCRNTFRPVRHDARFCSGRCRVAHHRSLHIPRA